MRTYHGNKRQGNWLVDIVSDNAPVKPLKAGPSQELINHSPDGFSWGYGGSGPAQLALALLLDATKDRDTAMNKYQEFKWQVVSRWPIDEEWTYTDDDIFDWLNRNSVHKDPKMKWRCGLRKECKSRQDPPEGGCYFGDRDGLSLEEEVPKFRNHGCRHEAQEIIASLRPDEEA